MTLRRVKSGLSKIRAEEALGEQVLHEHLADGLDVEVGVDGLAAELGEGRQSAQQRLRLVFFLFALDESHYPRG